VAIYHNSKLKIKYAPSDTQYRLLLRRLIAMTRQRHSRLTLALLAASQVRLKHKSSLTLTASQVRLKCKSSLTLSLKENHHKTANFQKSKKTLDENSHILNYNIK